MCKGRRDLPPRSHLRVAGLPPPGIRNWDAAADARIVKAIVQKIMQLISTDTDGKRILDYLGPVLKELMKSGDVKIMVQPACDFVVAEQERFSSMADEKLGERYALLRRYFESRLPQFGLACRGAAAEASCLSHTSISAMK